MLIRRKDNTYQESRTKSNNIKYLKQGVGITGYGNRTFETLVTDIAKIHTFFKRAVGPQLLDDLGISDADGYSAIDASNRYFSPRTELTSEADKCLITDDMDPKGSLRKAAGTSYIHTEDNKVLYFEKCDDVGG